MIRTMQYVSSIALLLVALQFLAGCNVVQAPPPATVVPSVTTAPPTPSLPTNTPKPPASPAVPPTPTVRVAGLRIAIQAPDNVIKIYGTEGGSTTLTQASSKLNVLNFTTATNAISETIYAGAHTAPYVIVDSAGVRPITPLKTQLTGVVVGGGRLAWGTLIITGTATTTSGGGALTELTIGQPDGSQPKSIAKQAIAKGQPPRGLTTFQFSGDGSRLYYSLEPIGLGGYILFGGATNLSSYSLKDGKTTELIKDKQFGSVCIDSVSPNDRLVAYHCSQKNIGIYDLATKKSTLISLPTDLKEIKVLGDARFNPDSTRVAFAAARNNPDDEQGWVMVSTGLTGASKMIAKSPAKDYYDLLAWVSADTLLLQSHYPLPSVWTVMVDGTGPQKLADGEFLSLLPARP